VIVPGTAEEPDVEPAETGCELAVFEGADGIFDTELPPILASEPEGTPARLVPADIRDEYDAERVDPGAKAGVDC
jgi:hypothetical protein